MNPFIRKAGYDDVSSLVYICRKSFPNRITWQMPGSSVKRIWEAIISWQNNETWVCTIDCKVVGFIILVIDKPEFLKLYCKEKKCTLNKIYSCILSPRLIWELFRMKINGFYGRLKKNKSRFDESELQYTNHTWINLIAVAPEFRRYGLAEKLINHSIQRTLQLKKEAIGLSAFSSNKSACKLYEKIGFNYLGSDELYTYYMMKIKDCHFVQKNAFLDR